MKTATGLALIALGAILAFAITAQPPFFNIHVIGWVLMLTGGVGIAVPRSRYGRLRRRTVWRGQRPVQRIEIEETDVEPKFSPLLVPGGLDSRDYDSKLTRDESGTSRPTAESTAEATRAETRMSDAS